MARVEFFVSCCSESLDFSGYTFILPTVSVGNVPQLTVDLLVNTCQLEKVGWINEDSILPLVGNSVFNFDTSDCLNTPSELYAHREKKVLLFQLRSPLAKNKSNQFVAKLLEWIETNGFAQVVVLTSTYSEERRDSDILSSPFKFVLNEKSFDLYDKFTTDYRWLQFEPRTRTRLPSPVAFDKSNLFLPGSGFAANFYLKCSSRLVMLVLFCSQGNNVPDAVNMADHLNQWVNFDKEKNEKNEWLLPKSWNVLFGGTYPYSLY